jgi:hypothetical protein
MSCCAQYLLVSIIECHFEHTCAVSHSGSGFPKDKLSAMYVERCRHFMENPPGDDWNGVWTMTEK